MPDAVTENKATTPVKFNLPAHDAWYSWIGIPQKHRECILIFNSEPESKKAAASDSTPAEPSHADRTFSQIITLLRQEGLDSQVSKKPILCCSHGNPTVSITCSLRVAHRLSAIDGLKELHDVTGTKIVIG